MNEVKLSRRDAIRAKRRRPTTITIPERVGPHARLVFAEMQRQGVTYDEVEEGSGVRRAALKAWRHKNAPGLISIEAVLGYLGWDLVPLPRAKVLPRPLIDDLQPIAERHGLSMTKTIEVLISLVAGVHEKADRGIGGSDGSHDPAPSTAPSEAEMAEAA